MADHSAPTPWFERWREAEPVRLYCWSVASVVLAGGVAVGLITTDVAVAVTGIVAAVLMVGAGAGARSVAYAPATVAEYAQTWDEFTAEEYRRGINDGIVAARERTPDELAAETTSFLAARSERAKERCREVVDGKRCGLRRKHGGPHMMPAE